MKNVFIIGATGSLGSEALRVIKDNRDKFSLLGVTGYKNFERLIDICKEFKPPYAGIQGKFIDYIKSQCSEDIAVFDVEKRLIEILEESDPDLVLVLSSGIGALESVDYLLKKGKTIGIANKETIIAGGELIFREENLKNIIPIDSEPSAIFQCLLGEQKKSVNKLIITASGGPFWDMSEEDLRYVKPEDALKHPNWVMGKKITIDSATMANKAFEVIESHFLFGVPYEKIQAIVHRESIIHSLVEFTDGNIKALMSKTRMYYPLQFAMSYPERIKTSIGFLDLAEVGMLTFFPMNIKKFPAFNVILNAVKDGGNRLPLLIAADEIGVKYFLEEKISFTDIPIVIEETLSKVPFSKLSSLKDVEESYKVGIMEAEKIVIRRKL